MQQRLSFITLGVADLQKSKRFYGDVLGWEPMHDADGIVMYKLNGMVLSLYPQHELMEDAEVKDDGRGSRFTLAQCLSSAEEVDALFAKLRKQKVTITKEPVKVFWGGKRLLRRSRWALVGDRAQPLRGNGCAGQCAGHEELIRA